MPTDLDIALVMEKFGGSFAKAIAKAWIAGDAQNRARVRAAFPDLFDRYAAPSWHRSVA